MDRFRPNTGQLLRSVALRYRPMSRLWGHLRAARGICRYVGSSPLVDQPLAANGPNVRDSRLARLEALLWLSEAPQGSRKLAQLARLADGTKARTLVRTLNRLYDAEGCAFRVEEVAGGFQLMTRPKFAPWLRRLHSAPVEVRLSAPALETLAVVAYRQPVLRAEIESIRGVQCGEMLRQLIERDLVRIVGRSRELGRPLLYGTTKQFLQVFGLRHLDELPKCKLLRTSTGPQGTEMPAAAAEHPDQHETSPNQPGVASQFVNEPAEATAAAADEMPNQLYHSRVAGEETNVKTAKISAIAEQFADQHATTMLLTQPSKPSAEKAAYRDDDEGDEDFADDLEDEDDDEEDEDDEFEEDEDLEDEPWEEVGEDEEDEDWDEDEDDEEEGWDDDDWDEDEDEEEGEDKEADKGD